MEKIKTLFLSVLTILLAIASLGFSWQYGKRKKEQTERAEALTEATDHIYKESAKADDELEKEISDAKNEPVNPGAFTEQ